MSKKGMDSRQASSHSNQPKTKPKERNLNAAVLNSTDLLTRDFNDLTATETRQLQRTIGNQALRRLYMQRQNSVGAAEPQMESIQRQEQDDELQTKRDMMLAGGAVSSDIETAVTTAKSGGVPLKDDIRQPMEQAFGADFSAVKIHTDNSADQLNRSLSARAFTTGQDVFFRQGQYDPNSRDGQKLIAHELTHVVQQNSGQIQRKTYLSNADQNVYTDSKTKTELSYIGPVGDKADKRSLFILYENFEKLQAFVEGKWKDILANPYSKVRKGVREGKAGPGSKPFDEDYGNNMRAVFLEIFSKQAYVDEFLGKISGPIYYEDEKGILQNLLLTPDMLTVLQSRMTDAAAYGPLYRHVGGGSRLPRAEGKLIIKHPTLTKHDILEATGVAGKDYEKYDGVAEIRQPDETEYNKLLLQARAKGGHIIEESKIGFFYASDVEQTRSKNARFTANGKNYDENFSTLIDDSLVEVSNSFKALKPPINKGWQKGTELGKVGREDGQAAAMDKWNALGAAAFANKHHGQRVNLNQNWEWLHIQGAQIGGETDGGNLVAGTFSTNSEMIPFESQIAKWANSDAEHLAVNFSAETGKHILPGWIKIQVAAEDHKDLGSIDAKDPLEVIFDPVSVKVVDKFSGLILAKQRKSQADSKQIPLDYEK